MNPAANLILVGPTGAGKSCIGRRLAEHYGLRLVDLDRAIEQCTGAAIPVIFDCEGEAGFRARESAALADALAGKGSAENGMVLAVGAGAVLDRDNRRLMREGGFVVHLQVTPDQQLSRLAHDTTRPLLQREDREVVLQAMAVERGPLYAEMADLAFDTGGLDSGAATKALLKRLDEEWKRMEPA